MSANDMASIAEHLKEFVSIIIDNYREGHGKEPMTPAQAKLLIWNEIDRCLISKIKLGRAIPLWLRIGDIGDPQSIFQVLDDIKKKKLGQIVTLRWLGPQNEGDKTVAYAIFKVKKHEVVQKIICEFDSKGFTIRDGTLGTHIL